MWRLPPTHYLLMTHCGKYFEDTTHLHSTRQHEVLHLILDLWNGVLVQMLLIGKIMHNVYKLLWSDISLSHYAYVNPFLTMIQLQMASDF